jgi:glycosyl transferase family 17
MLKEAAALTVAGTANHAALYEQAGRLAYAAGVRMPDIIPRRQGRKIIDCLLYNGEQELLDLHIETHMEFCDHIVILEAPVSFTGGEKALRYPEVADRYVHMNDRISYHVCGDAATSLEETSLMDRLPWYREAFQRNQAMRPLAALASADDIILVTDCDEILRPSVIDQLTEGFLSIRLPTFKWFINCIEIEQLGYQPSSGYALASAICTWEALLCHGPFYMRFFATRRRAVQEGKWIDDGGWHFSTIGDGSRIRCKLDAFSHVEYRHDWLTADSINRILDTLRRGDQSTLEPHLAVFAEEICRRFVAVPIDESSKRWLAS